MYMIHGFSPPPTPPTRATSNRRCAPQWNRENIRSRISEGFLSEAKKEHEGRERRGQVVSHAESADLVPVRENAKAIEYTIRMQSQF